MNVINLIKNLFKICKVLSTDDSGDMRFSQVSALGKKQKVLNFTPYGLMSHPPDTSVGLLWNQQAQGSNGIMIADDPPNRTLKDLAEGEVALGNYLTGDYVKFDADGQITVKNAAATITIDALGNAVITSLTLKHNLKDVGDTHTHTTTTTGNPTSPPL